MTSVSVVTPWLNARELIPDYVRAMELGEPDEILVYDTGSVPPLMGSEALFPETVKLLDATGYVSACNRGIENARSDAVLFLNNDIKARAPWLDPLRQALASGRLVGASLLSLPHARLGKRPVTYLDGWCLAGMRDDLLELGGLDDEYEEPAYWSDNDLCLRARAAGFKLVAVPIPLVHLGNWTSRTIPEQRDKASRANRERYLKKAEELLGISSGTR